MAEKYMMHIPSWEEGTRRLNLEQIGFYISLCNMMYRHDGLLVDDDQFNSHEFHISLRKYKALKKQLVTLGKINIQNGLLNNEKVLKEIRIINENSAKNSRIAHERWAKYYSNNPEKKPKSLKNNNLDYAIAGEAHIPPLNEKLCQNDAIQGNRGLKDNIKILSKKQIEDIFKKWVLIYPLEIEIDRSAALSEFAKAVGAVGEEKIMAGTEIYAEQREGKNPEFTMHPKNWLKKKRYLVGKLPVVTVKDSGEARGDVVSSEEILQTFDEATAEAPPEDLTALGGTG